MEILTISFLVCIIGLAAWFVFAKPSNVTNASGAWIRPLLSEAGKIMFAIGLLVTLLSVSGESLF